MDKYLKAIKENVCSVCVDSSKKGKCTLHKNESCAVEVFYPRIIEVIKKNEYKTYQEIHAALKEEICADCSGEDGSGSCVLHEDANCSLDRYFVSIIDVVRRVDAGKL
jgi:hypothetical protein